MAHLLTVFSNCLLSIDCFSERGSKQEESGRLNNVCRRIKEVQQTSSFKWLHDTMSCFVT